MRTYVHTCRHLSTREKCPPALQLLVVQIEELLDDLEAGSENNGADIHSVASLLLGCELCRCVQMCSVVVSECVLLCLRVHVCSTRRKKVEYKFVYFDIHLRMSTCACV